MLALFAALGMLLAAVGIYGVVGFLVAQRTEEIGVRVALGATPQSMLKMVLASVTGWVVAGVGTGWIASGFASRLLQSLLFPVSARDPRPRVRAVAILLLVAFFSAWIPARRALRVDPWVALRHE